MGNIKLMLQFPPIVTYTHIHISLSDVETCLLPTIYTSSFYSCWESRDLSSSQGKRKTTTKQKLKKEKETKPK